MLGKPVSIFMLSLLMVSALALAFNVQPSRANGTITIRGDGSIDPPTAPITTGDNVTYTFTGNIYDEIAVERDNIVVDGGGYTVQGSGVATGIIISGRTNVTIENTEIKTFREGIILQDSSNCNLFKNIVADSENGFGILLEGSSNNSISGNNIRLSAQAIPEPTSIGISILLSSNYDNISENTIENTFEGIGIQDSSSNNVSGNILRNNYYSIGVVDSNYVNISENTITSGETGIDLERCSNNIVSRNNITKNNYDGITLYPGALSNVLYNNDLENNNRGIILWEASLNSIYHNNFLNNFQVYVIASGYNNSWDNGYPSGGNFWSDYAGVDIKSGPSQNQPGSDGIGDTPYLIDNNNTDQYPLIKLWTSPVHNINTGLDYRTIQQAIDAPETLSGHTIIAGPGNYTENLNVNKSLKILGAGAELTRIIPFEPNDTAHVTANNLTIEGFTIQSVSGYSAVLLDNADNCSISNNTITGSGGGITLSGSSDNTVSANVILSQRGNGIWITDSSRRNKIVGNSLDSNHYGIVLFNASNYNVIADNFVNSSDWVGIRLNWLESNLPPVEFNNITGNIVCNNYEGIMLDYPSNHNPVDDNFVLDNYIGINLRQANNTTISGNTITNNYIGIDLESSSSNSISGNNITANNGDGIYLETSSGNNSINGNNIADNLEGIWLYSSSNNSFSENNIIGNKDIGVWIGDSSSNNSASGNNITNSGTGIWLYSSSNNSVSGNNVANNWYGIEFYFSSNNSLSGNNITNNGWGMDLSSSSSNSFYHNSFMNNTIRQVYSSGSNNVWDDGYPSGGNYWSDYVGADVNSGPGQNLPGSDGIGDTPYIIDASNTDHYPLMNPGTPPPIITATLDIEPHTLNLKSKSEWVTAYVELPEGYNVTDITVSTTRLNRTIPAELEPTTIGDYDNDTIPDLMVKFNRTAVSEFILSEGLMTGNVTLTITGNLRDRTLFQGSTVVTVRMPGDVNADGKVDGKDIALAAMAFGSCPEYPRWNGAADENEDNKIDGKDIVLIALNFGKTYV